jgi:hypothetical protein
MKALAVANTQKRKDLSFMGKLRVKKKRSRYQTIKGKTVGISRIGTNVSHESVAHGGEELTSSLGVLHCRSWLDEANQLTIRLKRIT